MSEHLPTVFISSTFFDLQQVRVELFDFLGNELGYRPLASEHPSFPVDPDASTIENCRRVVAAADALVLVVGGRYGSQIEPADRSITNIEYVTARAAGIPVFAFVRSSVLSQMPIWEANPQADFSAVVDSPRLFEFVKQVRAVDRTWTNEFSTGRDIIAGLRAQFAYQMKRGLALSRKLRGREDLLDSLSPGALRVVVDRAVGWQGRLFARVLQDGIARMGDVRVEQRNGLALGEGTRLVGILETTNWFQAKLGEVSSIAAGMTKVVNDMLTASLNSDSEREIATNTRLLIRAYQSALEWSLGVRRARPDDEDWKDVQDIVATFADDILEQLETLGPHVEAEIERVTHTSTEKSATLQINFAVTLPNLSEFNQAMAHLRRRKGME